MHRHSEDIPDPCPECGGFVDDSTTTVTLDAPLGVVVVRNVPAFVCRHCGESWLSEAVSEAIERRASRSIDQGAMLSILEFTDADV